MRTMTIALLMTFIVTVVSITANAGGEVGNGGGIGEQNFEFALQNLDEYYGLCLASETCGLTVDERVILQNIKNSLTQETQGPTALLSFLSETAVPGTFLIDGQPRVAKTGNTVGSTIFINADLIYPHDQNGVVTPLDVSAAVAVLTHELGHHHSVQNHQVLDILGAKVRGLIQGKTQRISWSNISLSTIDAGGFMQLLLTQSSAMSHAPQGGRVFDLSFIVRMISIDRCPFQNSELVGARLLNISWMQPRLGVTGAYSAILPVHAFVELSCVTESGLKTASGLEVSFDLDFIAGVPTTSLYYYEKPVIFTVDSSHALRVEITGDIEGTPFSSESVVRRGSSFNLEQGPYYLTVTPGIEYNPQLQVFSKNTADEWSSYLSTHTGYVINALGYWFSLHPNPNEAETSHFRMRVSLL